MSLALKATTQSTIVSQLSAYARNNKTKRAVWEYDNIIQSLYLLNYSTLHPYAKRAAGREPWGKLSFSGCRRPATRKSPCLTSGPTFVTLRPWKRTLSASDSGPTLRRAKSDFLSVKI